MRSAVAPLKLLTQLRQDHACLVHERARTVSDFQQRLDVNALDQALVEVFLCRTVNSLLRLKLEAAGYLSGNCNLTDTARQRLAVLFDQYQPQEAVR